MPPQYPERLTDASFWNLQYKGRKMVPFSENNWRNYIEIQFMRKLEALGLEHKKVCEVGGGDAKILAYLARKYPSSEFWVLDISPEGCALARERSQREGVSLEVCQRDLFDPGEELLEYFDIVISFGLVEHFTSLKGVLEAKQALLNSKGVLFTVIPNLSSPIYRFLAKSWSKDVYNKHVIHTLSSFQIGHEKAGLEIMQIGYLGSVEFGMLSMFFKSRAQSRIEWYLYLYLTRLSKLVHLFEFYLFDLPTTSLFSPFIYAIARKRS